MRVVFIWRFFMAKQMKMITRRDYSFETAFKLFIKEKRLLNLSQTTINGYKAGYELFIKYFDKNRNPNEIDRDVFINYMDFLKAEKVGASDVTIDTYLRNLRVILYYMMDEGYIQYFKIKLPKVSEKVKVPYTDEELLRLIQKPDLKSCNWCDIRNWAMVCYFIATGNRQRTVSYLKIGDVDFASNIIVLKNNKNSKVNTCPLTDNLKKVLKEYLLYRGGEPEDYLFCSIYGDRLTENGIKIAIREYNKSRGVEKTSTHLFRHTFATNWAKSGGSASELKTILGHSTITMSDKYIHLYGNQLQSSFERHNVFEKTINSMDNKQVKMKKLTKKR